MYEVKGDRIIVKTEADMRGIKGARYMKKTGIWSFPMDRLEEVRQFLEPAASPNYEIGEEWYDYFSDYRHLAAADS